MADGISNTGTDVEVAFRSLTGATTAQRAADGDAILEGNLVEIKKASAVTLNQVRATKYITLVAYYTPTASWYVVPALDVVRLVAKKSRGQHTENPFESATLSINNLSVFKVQEPGQLRAAVLAAVDKSARFPQVKAEMDRVLSESKRLAVESVRRVHAVLSEIGGEA